MHDHQHLISSGGTCASVVITGQGPIACDASARADPEYALGPAAGPTRGAGVDFA